MMEVHLVNEGGKLLLGLRSSLLPLSENLLLLKLSFSFRMHPLSSSSVRPASAVMMAKPSTSGSVRSPTSVVVVHTASTIPLV